MERNRGDLERKADREQPDREQRDDRRFAGALPRQRLANLFDPGRAGERKGERNPVEEEGARKSAEQEVFERGLGPACAAPPNTGEDVNSQRQNLERDEDDEQIGRGRHHHHAADGEEGQRIVLAGRNPLPLDDIPRHQHRQNADGAEHEVDEEGEVVGADDAHAVGVAVPERDRGDGCTGKTDEAEPGNRHPFPWLPECLGEHGGNRREGDDDEWNQCGVFGHYSLLARSRPAARGC